MIQVDTFGNLLGPSQFYVGQRVELHPATDAWMRGDRYGEIRKVTRKAYHIAMDRSGRVLRVRPGQVLQEI